MPHVVCRPDDANQTMSHSTVLITSRARDGQERIELRTSSSSFRNATSERLETRLLVFMEGARRMLKVSLRRQGEGRSGKIQSLRRNRLERKPNLTIRFHGWSHGGFSEERRARRLKESREGAVDEVSRESSAVKVPLQGSYS